MDWGGFASCFQMDLCTVISYFDRKLRPIRHLKETTQTLKRNIELLKCREADVNEQLQGAGHSGRKCKTEVQRWVNNISRYITEFESLEHKVHQSKIYHVCLRKRLAKRVMRMTNEAEELVEQSNFPGGLFLEDVREYTGQLLLTSQENNTALEQNLNKFWALFDKSTSIGIYGMGGVGKTLLAKHINDKLINESDIEVYWVTVSQEFSICKLQNDIAEALKLKSSSESDKIKRAGALFQTLWNKGRVVLILDDVWRKIDVKEVGIPLGMDKCKLVITSRSREVCHQMECQNIMKVNALSDEEAWDLFLTKLGHTDPEFSPEVIEVARRVAKKCDGLPLAVVAMAGSLRGITDIYEWRDVLEELNESRMEQEGMEKDVFPILECSFNRLRDSKLQSCFLYCSLYPEDYRIKRNELISMFISEGLLNRTSRQANLSMFISEGLLNRTSRQANFDQGHAILNKLENACLLERCEKLCVKMHDVIRDMALRITKGKYMVKVGLQFQVIPALNEWVEDLEKVSLMNNQYISEISCGDSPPNCPRLSTLILSGCFGLKLIAESFFVQMPGLQVLNLSSTSIKMLPNSVSNLEKLNALLLEECKSLRSVPPVGKLKALTQLNLKFSGVGELPKGIENLTNLKCLDMRGSDIKAIPKQVLRRNSNLQHLTLPGKIEMQIEELESLNQLEAFYGVFQDIHDFNQFARGQQRNMKLHFFHIFVGGRSDLWYTDGHKILTFREGTTKEKGINEDKIIVPSNVEVLSFENSGLCGFLFDHLQQLSNKTSGPIELKICREDYITGIMRLSCEEEKRTVEQVPEYWSCSVWLHSLCSLDLAFLPNFQCLFSKREGAAVAPLLPGTFSQLKFLSIRRCMKIKKLFPWSLVENLHNLEVLTVKECDQIEEIIGDDENELRSRGTACNSARAVVSLPRLRSLCLYLLPALERICKGKMICDSIKIIKILSCQNVSNIPLHLPLHDGKLSPPVSLKRIEVEEEWWKSLEWEHPDATNVLRPFLKFAKLANNYRFAVL